MAKVDVVVAASAAIAGTGRVWELEEKKDILFPTNFTIPTVKKVSDDPFEQAAYAYSLIESEVDGDGTK